MKKVWEKHNLPKSDTQQPSEKSNPTCNLRLSQAGYKVNGQKIDQTTYFRYEVFSECEWEKTEKGEKTYIPAELEINGRSYGKHKLKVTHELHRESNQDNVTTILHWGNAIWALTENDVTGEDLTFEKSDDGSYKISIH